MVKCFSNAQFGYVASPCDKKRYPNSLFWRGGGRQRGVCIADKAILLCVPRYSCFTSANDKVTEAATEKEEEGSTTTPRPSSTAKFHRKKKKTLPCSCTLWFSRVCVCAFSTNLITIHLERVFSVDELRLARVPSCGPACLAVIEPRPANRCEMSCWILKRLSLHLARTMAE